MWPGMSQAASRGVIRHKQIEMTWASFIELRIRAVGNRNDIGWHSQHSHTDQRAHSDERMAHRETKASARQKTTSHYRVEEILLLLKLLNIPRSWYGQPARFLLQRHFRCRSSKKRSSDVRSPEQPSLKQFPSDRGNRHGHR